MSENSTNTNNLDNLDNLKSKELFECYYQSIDKHWEYYERYSVNGVSRSRLITKKPEWYIEDPEGDYRYLVNQTKKLRKVNKKPDGEFYGYHNPAQVLIRDKYWNLKKSDYNFNPNIWFLDIETTANNKIDTETCPETIVLIQIYDEQRETMIVLGLEETKIRSYDYKVKFVKFDNERSLLEAFFKLIKTLKPLVVYAWNGDNFDFIYLFKRAIVNSLNPEFGAFGKGKLETRRLDNGTIYHTLKSEGTLYIDYLDLYKSKTYIPRESYSLDYIANVELGRGKVDHSCFSTFDGLRTGLSYIIPESRPEDEFEAKLYDCYLKNDMVEAKRISYEQFVHYGIIDTYLLHLLDKKLNLNSVLLRISSKMGINMDEATGTVRPWDNFLNNSVYLQKLILPAKPPEGEDSIKGGFVSDPQAGKWRDIISVDINSAYPNLAMRGGNMSPETILREDEIPEDLRIERDKFFNNEDEEQRLKDYIDGKLSRYTELLKKYNLSAGVSGALFRKDKKGVIPSMVGDLYAERKVEKAFMIEHKDKAEKVYEELVKRGIKI